MFFCFGVSIYFPGSGSGRHFSQQAIEQEATDRSDLPHEDAFHHLGDAGNCIPIAIAHIRSNYEEAAAWVKRKGVRNITASQEKARKYAQCLELLGGEALHPVAGCAVAPGGKFLLHIDGPSPHCVAVVVGEDQKVTVYDGWKGYSLGLQALLKAYSSSINQSDVVTFQICSATGLGHRDGLLELKAGGDDGDDGVECDVEACDAPELLLKALQAEVAAARKRLQDGMHTRRCPLCPFRSFTRSSRVAHHLDAYHTAKVNFCAGGSKQFRLVLALWDGDSAAGVDASDHYLARSSDIMRKTVKPHLDKGCMGIRADKGLRLLFSGNGPIYVNRKSVMRRRSGVRRVGNFFYDLDFALKMFRNALLSSGSITQTMCRVTQALSSSGCDTVALLPSHSSIWAKLLEDVLFSPAVTQCVQSHVEDCRKHGEFESLSIDCTFRMMMSLQGQAPYRAPRALRMLSALPADEAKHVVLSVLGKTGGLVALAPLGAESGPCVQQALEERLPQSCRDQVKHVCSDDPSKALLMCLRVACPHLAALSLDPMHIAFTYEAPSYRRSSPGSRFLRQILAFSVGRQAKGVLDDITIFQGRPQFA